MSQNSARSFICFRSEDHTVYAVEGLTGAVKWKLVTENSVDSSAAIGVDGTVYIGRYYCVSEFPLCYTCFVCLVLCLHITICFAAVACSEDSNVYALNGTTGAIKWKLTTGDVVASSPSIGPDGTVYVGRCLWLRQCSGCSFVSSVSLL